MSDSVDRPATGIWHELALGVSSPRLLLGLLIAVAVPAALTPLIVNMDAPVGLYILGVVPAALIGRLWPGLVAAIASFVLSDVFVSPPPSSLLPGPDDWVVLGLLTGIALLVAVEEAARARAGGVQERMAFLAEANRLLTGSLNYERAIEELTRLAVPRLADWCAVILRAPGVSEMTLHVAHSDPARQELAEELWRRYPPEPADEESPLMEVLRTGRAQVISRVPETMLQQVARDQDHLRLLRALGLRSAMLVPLVGRGRPMGALSLIQAESGRRYSRADLDFAMELGRTAAAAIETARLYQEQGRVAQTLQNSLLPPEIPEIPGVEVAVRYRPAGEGALVGGDFYDVFGTGTDAWAVALGDVCGKGPEAAALTGLVRHTIRTAAVRDQRPSKVLVQVNQQIIRNNAGRFCTVALGQIRRSNGSLRLTVSCGGHPPPLIYRAGRNVEAIDCLGSLLGVFQDPQLGDTPMDLEPGDVAVFYTDGLTERYERGGESGDARLVGLLWTCNGMDAERIADAIYRGAALAGSEVPRDDVAVVVLRVLPGKS
jgi:serine phosphatase RsbU (regulator of sigma subunit)